MKYLIVVSIDAMVYEDLEYAKTLVNFKEILKDSSIIKRVNSIYPTLTHPVHASIITGCTPGKTSITSNYIFNDESVYDNVNKWYNDLNQIQVKTLFHYAKEKNLKVATSSWPMTSGGNNVIDYLIPNALNECFIGYDKNPLDAYRALGAQEYIMDIIEKGVQKFGYKDIHPNVDRFQIFCACEIIKRYKPNLLFIHPSYIDSMRHKYGVFNDQVDIAIKETDEYLGQLINVLKEENIYEKTDIILMSDHGQIDITRVISLNTYLVKKGYIKLNNQNKIISWDAYIKSTGASAVVYLKDKNNLNLYNDIYKLLLEIQKEYGLDKVFTVEETKKLYGLYGDFSFVIETDGYTSFNDDVLEPIIKNFNFSDYRYGKGTHGYLPSKAAKPIYIAKGPSFKNGVIIEEGNILNHAPTIAKLFDIEMKNTDGEVVEELLNITNVVK